MLSNLCRSPASARSRRTSTVLAQIWSERSRCKSEKSCKVAESCLSCASFVCSRGTSWILEFLAVASCKDPKTDNEAADDSGVMVVLKSFIFEERGVRCGNLVTKVRWGIHSWLNLRIIAKQLFFHPQPLHQFKVLYLCISTMNWLRLCHRKNGPRDLGWDSYSISIYAFCIIFVAFAYEESLTTHDVTQWKEFVAACECGSWNMQNESRIFTEKLGWRWSLHQAFVAPAFCGITAQSVIKGL